MHFSNKMLINWFRNISGFACVMMIFTVAACHKKADPIMVGRQQGTTKVEIFFKDFESTSPASLNETALKSASDLKLSLSDKKHIDRIEREIDITSCGNVKDVNDVGDMRLLIEFKSGEFASRVWRGSQFYFRDGNDGKICALSVEDRIRLQKLLKSLG